MVTLVQLVTLIGMVTAILGAGTALAASLNGKHIKQSQDHLEALLMQMREDSQKRSDEHQAMLKEMQATIGQVQAAQRDIAKILERMEERAEKRHQEVMEKLA